MDLATALTFLRDHAAGLRLQALGYSASSKVRAGLVAQADALTAYADALAAEPPLPPSSPVLVLLV
jgi:hypothetical protein